MRYCTESAHVTASKHASGKGRLAFAFRSHTSPKSTCIPDLSTKSQPAYPISVPKVNLHNRFQYPKSTCIPDLSTQSQPAYPIS
eukprot:1136358-Rhodomonas_salina.1